MSDFDPVQMARAAYKDGKYAQAESILNDALKTAEAHQLREALLRQLFFLYLSPLYEHLEKAEWCLQQIEEFNPSAENAQEWTYFMHYCKKSPSEAEQWAQVTAQRAESEGDTEKLYTAISSEGLFAARRGDSSGAHDALHKLTSLVQQGLPVRYGDEVAFLEESLALNEETRKEVAAFARVIATRIEDPAFRARAESIAGPSL
jgi:hypothetical protein